MKKVPILLSVGLLTLFTSINLMPNALAGEKHRQAKCEDNGRVDWNRGVITATGLGAMSNKEGNDAKAYLRARSFARMDARRNLLAVISHVKIDSKTTGQDYEATSDEIREEISGLVKGSEITGERKIRMGNSYMVEVTVTMPLYGESGVAGVFLPETLRREKEEHKKLEDDPLPEREERPIPEYREGQETRDLPNTTPLPEPYREREPEPAPIRRIPDTSEPVLSTQPLPGRVGYYTSVIVDARGLGTERCMAPKIRTQSGREVWGSVNVDADYVIEHGIVSYVHSLDEAKRNARAGKNPIVLRGIACSGNRFNTDVGLTEEDAELLRDVDRNSRFLDKCRVIFIVDMGK